MISVFMHKGQDRVNIVEVYINTGMARLCFISLSMLR